MIIMPAWVVEEVPEGYKCRLGSQPDLNSKIELIPREHVKNCVYSDPESQGFGRLAIFVLDESCAESLGVTTRK